MLVYVSLRQLLLYQMGYLLFNELKTTTTTNSKSSRNDNNIMERLKILQTAFEQLKSYKHNHHFQTMIENLDFDLDEDELKELHKLDTNQGLQTEVNNDINPNHENDTKYLHPFGFGMWLQEQTFINLGWTGTMDDSETTKQFWRQLTGNAFIKMWKKQKINKQNIIQHYNSNLDDDNMPYIDISIDGNSVVKAGQFRMSLCQNRMFQLKIPNNSPSKSLNPTQHTIDFTKITTRASRPSVDHSKVDQNGDRTDNNNVRHKQSPSNPTQETMHRMNDDISGINLFNTVVNQDLLRIACCMLWEPELAINVLNELIIDPSFDINGRHKPQSEIKETDSLQPTPTPTDRINDGYNLQLPMVAAQLINQQSAPSVGSSPAPPSITSQGRFSNISTNTAYTGHGFGNIDCDMNEDEIYKYLMEMDYSDKKNPVKYEWKLMVDALNAFQFKVVSIDDYTDDDILKMVNRMQEGLLNSVHDQRSGLIKVACNLLVLIAQYRTPLFFDEEFFKFWMLCLLRKCANRDRIRTLPAHNACRDIVACILSYYVNNKDNSKEFSISKLKDMFITFSSLWTPKEIDPTWMKQVKSVTQFIKIISLMIKHTAVLHQAPANKVDEVIAFDIIENGKKKQEADDEKEKEEEQDINISPKPIENKDIQEMQDIAFDLFKKFTKQSHKEARECGIDLLINLYKLEKERTFEFAKKHFVKRELMDYLKKLKKLSLLSDEHNLYLDTLSNKGTRSRIRKGIKKKKSKSSSDMKSQIRKLKKKQKQNTLTSLTRQNSIPEESSTDKEPKSDTYKIHKTDSNLPESSENNSKHRPSIVGSSELSVNKTI